MRLPSLTDFMSDKQTRGVLPRPTIPLAIAELVSSLGSQLMSRVDNNPSEIDFSTLRFIAPPSPHERHQVLTVRSKRVESGCWRSVTVRIQFD